MFCMFGRFYFLGYNLIGNNLIIEILYILISYQEGLIENTQEMETPGYSST